MIFDFKQSNEDRLRRAKSWYQQGIKDTNSDEECFLFLWVAFNAAYGRAYESTAEVERKCFEEFINKIIHEDKEHKIHKWLHSLNTLGGLLKNCYIYEPFWRAKRENKGNSWERWFDIENKAVFDVWGKEGKDDVAKLLCTVLSRLYTLRNQMLHGGMTFGNSFGKSQLHHSCPVMKGLMKLIIDIMETDIVANPDTQKWGKVAYLRFNKRPD